MHIPSLMQDLTSGSSSGIVSTPTVGQTIEALDQAYPGIEARLCEAGHLRGGFMAFADGHEATLGLQQPLTDHSEVRFLPVIRGG